MSPSLYHKKIKSKLNLGKELDKFCEIGIEPIEYATLPTLSQEDTLF